MISLMGRQLSMLDIASVKPAAKKDGLQLEGKEN